MWSSAESAYTTSIIYGARLFQEDHLAVIAMRTQRLVSSDRGLARELFVMMAAVFDEGHEPLSDAYIDQLLQRADFWVIAALDGDTIVGGLTAHILPLTRREVSEFFIYDLAVRTDYQRRGIGRELVQALRQAAATIGIYTVFVPADNDDTHALDFYRAIGGEASPVTFFTFETTGRE